jgi:hypothetical protein
VVKVNLLGILLGTKAAMDIMAQQVSAKGWHRLFVRRKKQEIFVSTSFIDLQVRRIATTR